MSTSLGLKGNANDIAIDTVCTRVARVKTEWVLVRVKVGSLSCRGNIAGTVSSSTGGILSPGWNDWINHLPKELAMASVVILGMRTLVTREYALKASKDRLPIKTIVSSFFVLFKFFSYLCLTNTIVR